MTPTISIIIPTHDRRESVVALVQALARQQLANGTFEMRVVCDGCTDDTGAALRALHVAAPLLVAEQPPLGPAAARNLGASHAEGGILLFLDDDVEPMPGLVQAHEAFHTNLPNGLAIGDLLPGVVQTGFFGVIVRGWLEAMCDGLREPGHRHVYRDVLTGHLSIRRELFDRLGGFDPSFRCHEDYELGYRAIEAGLTVRFLPDAVAVHHDRTDLSKAFRRKFEEGVADVGLCARHPPLCAVVPLARTRERGRLGRLLMAMAWACPSVGDVIAWRLRAPLRAYEVPRLRFRWRALLEDLLDYWYWRGVAHAAGDRGRLRDLLVKCPPRGAPELAVDLAAGIRAARAQLGASGPASLRLMYGQEHVGDVGAEPGAERLRGEHLPRIIVRDMAQQYLRAASRAGGIPSPLPGFSESMFPPIPGRPEAERVADPVAV
jgi:GT2 family glycosyltransferase